MTCSRSYASGSAAQEALGVLDRPALALPQPDEPALATPDDLEQGERGVRVGQRAPSPRRPEPAPEPDADAAATRKPRTAKAEGAVELLRLATSAYEQAMSDSASAPPSPGYVDRIRAVAESC